MTHKIMLIAAISSLLLFSCTKENTSVQANNNTTSGGSITAKREGGEDGDIIIINHKLVDVSGTPIFAAGDTLTDGVTTYTGITDQAGWCIFKVSHLGTWSAYAGHSNYVPFHTMFTIVDTISSRVDTMLVN